MDPMRFRNQKLINMTDQKINMLKIIRVMDQLTAHRIGKTISKQILLLSKKLKFSKEHLKTALDLEI
jgi:hypothetical protein